MAKKAPRILDNTPDEDQAIQAAIAADPDTFEADASVRRVGRPRGRTKRQVTVSLDADLIEALRGDNPKGWQTRLNKAARDGLGMK
ncbi:BrnA antitoxin family protein [Roseospirillum parvum]|uniref:BrnA antitoxin of type II toxin-antitoxin system n=1 Tax=Roseospirillum parvum TaxID=83401 RepID=A0A1G8B3B4_9PROT|nr:BrnA antitoxin family protein [Roseospirillum parvum]SDH27513.1 BrnA antitoxin of type II toxin-antitoxin system [Roseospirillum parvum]